MILLEYSSLLQLIAYWLLAYLLKCIMLAVCHYHFRVMVNWNVNYKNKTVTECIWFFSMLHKTTRRAYFQKGRRGQRGQGKYELWSALQEQLRADWLTHAGILEEKERITALSLYFTLLDTDMRWKSEVKAECCAVSEDENGSLLSNDEVSNDI